ncbi:tryptophan-rich sensory protein [Rhizobium sp. NPDC090279]
MDRDPRDIRSFHRLDQPAAYALLPLAFWVAFAFALNFEIWRLNG